jgi:hypothetical protein
MDHTLWKLSEEIEELHIQEVNKLCDRIKELKALLKPLADCYLYPDDLGEEFAKDMREDADWDEEYNDSQYEEVFIKREHIRNARLAIKDKS